jgi:hypothetical protein
VQGPTTLAGEIRHVTITAIHPNSLAGRLADAETAEAA